MEALKDIVQMTLVKAGMNTNLRKKVMSKMEKVD